MVFRNDSSTARSYLGGGGDLNLSFLRIPNPRLLGPNLRKWEQWLLSHSISIGLARTWSSRFYVG